MSDEDGRDRLTRLGRELDKAQAAQAPPLRSNRGAVSGGAIGFGFRVGLELVVAIGAATALGWAIDHWLGTRPWGMIVLFFLGVGAGMVNVYRAVANLGMKVGYRPSAAATGGQEDDEE
jgi:ATP synthase protein I